MRFSFVAALAVVASAAPALSLPLSDLGVLARALKYRNPMDYDSIMARSQVNAYSTAPWDPIKGKIGIPLHQVDAREPYRLLPDTPDVGACRRPGVICARGVPVATFPTSDLYVPSCGPNGEGCKREDVFARSPIVAAPGSTYNFPSCHKGNMYCLRGY
ncbi:hypothetical protein B0H21DRAFT_756761 [Amylocystis lapponica]|nr:hypothetical protein B0H21DRAFT_756761 [Amylocystis lapponica]